MNSKIRERLDSMARAERRNNDRVNGYSTEEFIERHMRERLAEIRHRPTRNEAAKQQIIERYESDLASWADGGK